MRKLAVVLLSGALVFGGAAAFAAGESGGETLVTKSYLTNTYMPDLSEQAGNRVDAKLGQLYGGAEARLKARADLYLVKAGAASDGGYADTFTEQRFKRGDVITFDTGSEVMLLAGAAQLSYEGGGVVDVTGGTSVDSGTLLTAGRRYLAAENTLCTVTVTSDTAVLAPRGYYALSLSVETDYNALADALKSMGMFKGSDTGYGSGYDLEKVPTRIEGLIMFLRLMGEEGAALSYGGSHPFTDVPDWCAPYVAYAYDKGYTKGVDSIKMLFGPQYQITSGEYLTFVLRALGYTDGGDSPDFAWNTALARAMELGVINAQEHKLLTEQPFLRAQVAYLSYFALDAGTKDGDTLLKTLTASGVLDAKLVRSIRGGVAVQRLS